jgi:glycosyltransferase involved in cell wall biosynthesis
LVGGQTPHHGEVVLSLRRLNAIREIDTQSNTMTCEAGVAVLDLYPRAIAVVSTSEYEGFSNVFLEAWSHGVPALSLRIDPDGVIGRLGLGEVAGGSVETLAAAVRRFVEQPEPGERAGDAGYRYVAECHSPDVVGRQWVDLVRGLLAG